MTRATEYPHSMLAFRETTMKRLTALFGKESQKLNTFRNYDVVIAGYHFVGYPYEITEVQLDFLLLRSYDNDAPIDVEKFNTELSTRNERLFKACPDWYGSLQYDVHYGQAAEYDGNVEVYDIELCYRPKPDASNIGRQNILNWNFGLVFLLQDEV